MKKTLAVLAIVVATLIGASSARACSNAPISWEKTRSTQYMFVHTQQAKTFVMMTAKDADGVDLCSLSSYEVGTSRNDHAPSNGWAPNVDVIDVYSLGNTLYIWLTTEKSAGTTAHVDINDVTVSETPFSYQM